jgi:hypothetical protein
MDTAKNFAKATLAATLLSTDTSLNVGAGQGARFPVPPFNATIWNSTDFPDPSDDPDVEIIRVSAITADTFDTIARGQEGTDARDHDAEGKTYQIVAGITAKVVNEDLNYGIEVDSINNSAQMIKNGAGWLVDGGNNRTILGDLSNSFNGTFIDIEDDNSRVSITNQPIFPDLPSSDPAIAGALYYDAATGIVKRSAG